MFFIHNRITYLIQKEPISETIRQKIDNNPRNSLTKKEIGKKRDPRKKTHMAKEKYLLKTRRTHKHLSTNKENRRGKGC